jgi:hypothetical protein
MRLTNYLFTFAEMSASVHDSTFAQVDGSSLTSSIRIATVQAAEGTLQVNSLVGPANRCPTWDELVAQAVSPTTVRVTNNLFNVTITNITGISGFTFDTSSPVGTGDSQSGTHTTITSVHIYVSLTGTANIQGNLSLTKNGTLIQSISVPTGPGNATGFYTFSTFSAASSDIVRVDANTG